VAFPFTPFVGVPFSSPSLIIGQMTTSTGGAAHALPAHARACGGLMTLRTGIWRRCYRRLRLPLIIPSCRCGRNDGAERTRLPWLSLHSLCFLYLFSVASGGWDYGGCMTRLPSYLYQHGRVTLRFRAGWEEHLTADISLCCRHACLSANHLDDRRTWLRGIISYAGCRRLRAAAILCA